MNKKNSFLPPPRHIISYVTTVIVRYILKWQYRAGNGAGANIRGKVKPEEPEPKLNNFGSQHCSTEYIL